MRVLALDVGQRRIGFAISDPTRTLARPLLTLKVGPTDAVDRVARQVVALALEEDGVGEIVVGLPTRLDGTPTPHTAVVLSFIENLKGATAIPIVTQDERLTSREAESRLAVREKDWRKRKARLDAVAASIFLQDYLDWRAGDLVSGVSDR